MKTNRHRRLIRLMRKAFGDFSSSTGCLSPLHCVGCCFGLIVVNYWASNDSKRRRGNKLILNHLRALLVLGVGFAGSFASFSALVASYFYYFHLIERSERRERNWFGAKKKSRNTIARLPNGNRWYVKLRWPLRIVNSSSSIGSIKYSSERRLGIPGRRRGGEKSLNL